jgi:hypothetical protein
VPQLLPRTKLPAAPLPVPPPWDIPDRDKTARIAKLEQDLSHLTAQVADLTALSKQLNALKNPVPAPPFKVQLVSTSKKTGKQIVIGEIQIDPEAGGTYQLALPDTTVQWLHHETGAVESQGSFAAGTPVKLIVTPKMLGQEKNDGS